MKALKKLMFTILPLAICSYAPIASMAQSEPTTSTISVLKPTPVSPEAASFIKYGDTPVGLFNGIPEISIPIYTISMKGISVPIKLDYHAGGIRMDEVASNVGLGWSLDFGGGMTTSVNGKPDFGGWITQSQKIPQYPNSQPNTFSWLNYLGDPAYNFLLACSRDLIDTQPDMFYVNMNGRSFKFYCDQDHNFFTVPYQRVKFLNQWTIVDENDTKFSFNVTEINMSNSSTSGIDDLSDPSASYDTNYISEIVTANNDVITYEYEDYSYSFQNQPSETRFANNAGEGYGCNTPNGGITTSETFISGKRIKKITASNGIEVEFTYGLARTDLPNTYALTAVSIKNTHSNTTLYTYSLNYGYYSSGGSTPNDFRLKLLSVQKTGENSYVFDYIGGNGVFPERLSKSQDHWGYYNGYGGNTLLPVDVANGFTSGTSREPSEIFASIGTLNKITYPTGGNTEFEYESNQFVENGVNKIWGGIRIKSITDNPLIGLSKTRHYKYLAVGNSLPVPTYVYTIIRKNNIDGEGDPINNIDCQFVVQSSACIAALGVKGGPVNYTDVEVYTDAQTKGYTHYIFSSNGQGSPHFGYPFAAYIPYDWIDGLPLSTTDYLWDAASSAYRPVKKIINEYKTDYGHMNGNITKPHEFEHWAMKVVLTVPGIPVILSSPITPRNPEFVTVYYPLYSSWSYITKTTEIIYDPTDSNKNIAKETKFFYDSPLHENVTRQEVTKSENEKYNYLFRYPRDYNPSYPYNANPLVEKRVMINTGGTDRLIDAELTTYLNQPGSFPDKKYKLDLSTAVNPSTVPLYTGSATGNYEQRASYGYDNKNNLATIVENNAVNTVYLYSYAGQYPIAEIKNATYTVIETILGGTTNINSFRDEANPSKAEIDSFLAPLKQNLPNAQITTYTYQSSVGLSSMTDPKGMTVNYEYDNLQRLKAVRDQHGNIVKQFDYHFKQP